MVNDFHTIHELKQRCGKHISHANVVVHTKRPPLLSLQYRLCKEVTRDHLQPNEDSIRAIDWTTLVSSFTKPTPQQFMTVNIDIFQRGFMRSEYFQMPSTLRQVLGPLIFQVQRFLTKIPIAIQAPKLLIVSIRYRRHFLFACFVPIPASHCSMGT